MARRYSFTMIYYAYDQTLWREHPDGALEMYTGSEWAPAAGERTPSEGDLDHMQEIPEREAREALPNAF